MSANPGQRDPDLIVDGSFDVLLASDVSLSRLDGNLGRNPRRNWD
jgi:hypothetical protein